MMMLGSDESLESFFRKEGTSRKKESPPIEKKPIHLEKKKPPAEKKSPPMVKTKQLGLEQDKKKRHPWITKFWKEKEVPYTDIRAYANYVGSKTFGFYNEAEFDKYTALDAEQEGYNPG
jgi:hypothetical protein